MIQTKDISDAAVVRLFVPRAGWTNIFYLYDAVATIAQALNAPEKVIVSKLNKMLDAGLVEWGSSMRACWLTAAGREARQ